MIAKKRAGFVLGVREGEVRVFGPFETTDGRVVGHPGMSIGEAQGRHRVILFVISFYSLLIRYKHVVCSKSYDLEDIASRCSVFVNLLSPGRDRPLDW